MPAVPLIAPAQLAADLAVVTIIDVREPDEVATGTIAGSVAIPLAIPLGSLRRRIGELDRGARHVTVCRSGRRSRTAAELLAEAGFTVAGLDGGIDRWTTEGHPLAPAG